MEMKPVAALTLEEALQDTRIEIERRSNFERSLAPCEGWFRDPYDSDDLFWRVVSTDGRWAIYGYERMGWEPVGSGGWLIDDTWGRLHEIIEKKTAVEMP